LRALNGFFKSEIKEIEDSENNKGEVAEELINDLKALYPELQDGEFQIKDVG